MNIKEIIITVLLSFILFGIGYCSYHNRSEACYVVVLEDGTVLKDPREECKYYSGGNENSK